MILFCAIIYLLLECLQYYLLKNKQIFFDSINYNFLKLKLSYDIQNWLTTSKYLLIQPTCRKTKQFWLVTTSNNDLYQILIPINELSYSKVKTYRFYLPTINLPLSRWSTFHCTPIQSLFHFKYSILLHRELDGKSRRKAHRDGEKTVRVVDLNAVVVLRRFRALSNQ